MQRKFKFRVWDIQHKKFIRPDYFSIGLDGTLIQRVICYGDDPGNTWDDSWNEELDDDKYEVQQFTGLSDKNGREIYEGDIISGSFYDEEYRHAKTLNAAVAFNNGAFNISSTNWHKPLLKVIGNIFEDSALLG
jgi:hypothetical protein